MAVHAGGRVNSATGGIISNINGYTIHTFTSSGTFTASTTGMVEVLVVGGGGGGGTYNTYGGGGGGAGATLYSKFVPVVAGVACPVTVGAPGNFNQSGGTSIFYYGGPTAPATTNITAGGGGGGGYWSSSTPGTSIGLSSPTASGGGSSAYSGTNIGGTGAGVYGLGFPGGGVPGGTMGAGGGGAGSVGGTQPYASLVSGGLGVPYSITGTAVTYSVGGPNNAPNFPTGSTFGCGGAAYGSNYSSPASGNSGAVIIRYPV
jgi:hypothetical protein